MKVLLDHNPLAPSNSAPVDFGAALRTRPAWITAQAPSSQSQFQSLSQSTSGARPEVNAYRLQFELPEAAVIRVHVSADERYLLYLDGEAVGRGPERGSDRAWFYESYDLPLTAGAHTLVALVWQLGEVAPLAQVGLAGGFLLEAEGAYGALLATKSAAWTCKPVGGISFDLPEGARRMAWFVEPIQTTDGTTYPWGIERGEGEGWMPAGARREDLAFPYGIHPAHVLQPALLPGQLAHPRQGGSVRYATAAAWEDPQLIAVPAGGGPGPEAAAWQAWLDGAQPLAIPPHSHRQVILDLNEYVCAYPQLELSGGRGSRVVVGWAEALHLDASGESKGQRDGVEGRTFIALCRDVILPDGGELRQFETLWWRAGRYVALLIATADEPLTLERCGFLETRYPLEMESRFRSSDPRLDAITPLALRSLQMCAHETYMDCPYYEQMMYVGDTRLEVLTTYTISRDDRLPRKALLLYGLSRLPDGLTQARYPSRDVQVIPPFALWWAGMVYDYALWRSDRDFAAALLPGVRAVLDGFLAYVDAGDLLQAPPGWNFADWIEAWPIGVPPDGFNGCSGLLHWHLVYTLGLAARLEEWVGDPVGAQRWESWRGRLAAAGKAHFWDDARGLFADDLAHTSFSEHSQCLALLSGVLEGEQRARTAQNLLGDPALTRATIYFTHYLFETYRLLEQPAAFFVRLGLWFDLPAQGFKTTPEQPEPSRSDCHGWGAHPLYHFFATVLGIRPAAPGFAEVEIRPMPGDLTELAGELVHPRGLIAVDLRFTPGHVRGSVVLPEGLLGTFYYGGKTIGLRPGRQVVEL